MESNKQELNFDHLDKYQINSWFKIKGFRNISQTFKLTKVNFTRLAKATSLIRPDLTLIDRSGTTKVGYFIDPPTKDFKYPKLVTITNKNQDQRDLTNKYGSEDKLLGKGTYGEVYLYQKDVNGKTKRYAVKKMKYVIKDTSIIEDTSNIEDTSIIEINAMLRCRHPNVLNLVDYYISDDLSYLYSVTEYMNLGNLYNYVNREDFRPNMEAKNIVYQILLGVAHMHSLDIIHRDLKPQNILVDSSGIVKIADLGSATILDCSLPDKSKNTNVMTLGYRSPEIIMDMNYGYGIDIWSMGCIVFELLTGF